MDLTHFIADFLSIPRCKVVAVNAAAGVSVGLHHLRATRQLFRTAFDNWKAVPNAIAEYQLLRSTGDESRFDSYLVALLDVARRGRLPAATLFACQIGIPLKYPESSITTVVRVANLARIIQTFASDDDLDRFSSRCIDLGTSYVDEEWAEDLQSLGTAELYFVPDRAKVGAHYANMTWFTSTEDLVHVLKGAAMHVAADLARDRLGLVHRLSGEWLAKISYPASILTKVKHARPTFVEANSHRRFRARASGESRPTKEAWGRTIDLAALAGSRSLAGGGPERVADRIENRHFASREVVRFEVLGRIGSDRGLTRSDDDSAYVRRLGGRMTDKGLRKVCGA